MRLKLINIKTVFISLLTLFTSCELDLSPVDEITDDKAFVTIEDLEKGRVGVMAYYGGFAIVGVTDYASDDLRYSSSNRGQGVNVHDWTYNASTDDMVSVWDGNAHLVDAANRILEIADKFDQEEATVKKTIAECLFTRAFGHFEVLRAYAPNYSADAHGIPYMKQSVISEPARLTQGEVYQNILSDIDAAIPGLDQFVDGNYWVTQSAAYALKARVAQYMGDWDMAIEAADLAISTGGFRLAEIDEVQQIWNDEVADDVEVIFRKEILSSRLGDYYTSSSNQDIYFHPSHSLMDSYEDDDIRKTEYFGKNDNSQDVVKKHDGRASGSTNVVDIKYFRVSEMVLIKAEAYINKDLLGEAQAEIELLRSKRIIDPDPVDMSIKSLAMNVLQAERRRELAYEGHRFIDLRRWNLGIERVDEDVPSGRQKVLESGDYRFVFPIPQDEIFANGNMQQNEGYSN